jgi:hypothetical protein
VKDEVKAKWVAALRSGKYDQTKGYLRRTKPSKMSGDAPGFCCLGVLCDIAVKEGVIPEPEFDGGSVAIYGVRDEDTYRGSSEVSLPDAVVQWAGLDEGDPQLPATIDPDRLDQIDDFGDPVMVALSDLNDDWDYDFNKIADGIEAHL